MNSVLLFKTVMILYLCVAGHSQDTTQDTTAGTTGVIDDSPPTCFNIATRPMGRAIYDYNRGGDPYQGEPHVDAIEYYVLDSQGNQIASSADGTNRVCFSNGRDECHYLVLEGHGLYMMVDDNNNVLSQGDIVFSRPKLIRMGHCPHHCDDEEQQLVLLGEKGENPSLIDGGDNPKAVKEIFLDSPVLKEEQIQPNASNASDIQNVEIAEAAAAAAATVERSSKFIVKTMCLSLAGCYKLVGSAVYVISGSDSVILEQGTTYDGYNTIGDTDKCYQRCVEKPLLVDTKRGQEITLTLSSISGMESLTNVNSPQYLAACWLIHEDLRQLTAADNNIIQRYILALFFYTLNGPEWTLNYDFLTQKDECKWTKWTYFNGLRYFFADGNGVICNDSGEVSKIVLADNNLVGTLPPEVSWLTQIEFLELSSNTIQGSIPYQFGHLKNLRTFRFRQNSLTGTLPQSFAQIDSLVVVDVGNNLLEGSMISTPRPCNLYAIDFRHNMISGTIPNDIGRCTSLGVINVNSNLLTGTIPESMGYLERLERISLQSNNFIGSIPSQILSWRHLTTFWAAENALSGSIPNNVTNGTALLAVLLDHNQLTGTIPPELSLATGLRHLYLQNNDLTGELAPDFVKLPSLSVLRLQNTEISGLIPFETCDQFAHLEADCGSPQKVSCPCCTNCHGIFKVHDDTFACPSRELTIVFGGLSAGNYLNFMLQSSEGEILDNHDTSAKTTSLTYTTCISTSSCFDLLFSSWTSLPFEITVSVDDTVVAEEFVTQSSSVYHFGYSLVNGSIAQDTCDSFKLCNTTLEPNSTKRELVNQLTRITGIEVFNNSSSPYYRAACEWMNFLNKNDEEDSMPSKLIQHYILAFIYFVTNGEEWFHSDLWLTDEPYCSWFGIVCDGYGIITTVDLSYNNLVGTIPTEIAQLRGIEELLLSYNYLSGAIPLEIGKLQRLRRLRASHNILLGNLPSEIGLLSDTLTEVDLGYNQLANAIPTEVGELKTIQFFDLYNNTFSGEIPDSFYSLAGLRYLSLGANLFAGDARRLGTFGNLEWLDLSDNFFTGSIPLTGYLSNLQVLRLSGNRFEGSIPMSVGQLQLLEEIFLHSNRLTGNLPSEIGKLESLVSVSFSYNDIKGSIPTEIGNLRKLDLLHLHGNLIEGKADHFDYDLREYITDCGNTKTSESMVECDSCSSCCNVDGDCLWKDLTWPRPGDLVQTSQIEPRMFIFVMTLASTSALVLLLFIFSLFWGVKKFSIVEFQGDSVYKFFLSKNYWATSLAILSVLLQFFLLSIFIEASAFTSPRNDWEYSTSCPNNSINCEDRRGITPMAWFAFSCILASYLLKDILQGSKMIYECIILRSFRGVLAGFVIIFVTIASIEASALYNYSTGISNTDILKDAVILLFLNDIDEQLYTLVRTVGPNWVEDRNKSVRRWLDTKIRKLRRLNTGLKIYGMNLKNNMKSERGSVLQKDTEPVLEKDMEPVLEKDMEDGFDEKPFQPLDNFDRNQIQIQMKAMYENRIQELEREFNNLDRFQMHMRTIYEKEIMDSKTQNAELENRVTSLEKEIVDLKKICLEFGEREIEEGEGEGDGEPSTRSTFLDEDKFE